MKVDFEIEPYLSLNKLRMVTLTDSVLSKSDGV